mmetsp:Transcript_13057/g.17852  ORF Transcript_13057/g.17852 Transcript_13057/m.17852 type:complete len:200 (-) Transcript_13057:247-846(-)
MNKAGLLEARKCPRELLKNPTCSSSGDVGNKAHRLTFPATNVSSLASPIISAISQSTPCTGPDTFPKVESAAAKGKTGKRVITGKELKLSGEWKIVASAHGISQTRAQCRPIGLANGDDIWSAISGETRFFRATGVENPSSSQREDIPPPLKSVPNKSMSSKSSSKSKFPKDDFGDSSELDSSENRSAQFAPSFEISCA